MALVLKDRVKQQTTTTGTGTYTLSGSFTGFETFAEIGIGTYASAGTTLARTTILQSSNADAAVSWAAGTRTVFCTLPAQKVIHTDNLSTEGATYFDPAGEAVALA